MKKAVIIQARMASTRLPGKVLMKLNDKPCLRHIIERCQRAKRIDQIIVTVTDDPKDESIMAYCDLLNIPYYIGKGTDVYNQVLENAKFHNVDLIVEVTADCPMIDPYHIDILVKNFLKRKNVLYASNVFPRTFPDGFDIQVYKTEILDLYNNFVTKPVHRRHVGWNIMTRIDSENIWSLITKDIRSDPKMRLTLDTKEDHEVINKIFTDFGHNHFSFPDVLDYLQYHPELLEINKNVRTKIAGEEG